MLPFQDLLKNILGLVIFRADEFSSKSAWGIPPCPAPQELWSVSSPGEQETYITVCGHGEVVCMARVN